MSFILEPPLAFPQAMMTTSSRLHHLDAQFSFSGFCNSNKPKNAEPMESASVNLSIPSIIITKTKSSSQLSVNTGNTSFHSASSESRREPREVEMPVTSDSTTNVAKSAPENVRIIMLEDQDFQASPVQSREGERAKLPDAKRKEMHKKGHERSWSDPPQIRRASTSSEPLPLSAIPRRRSSTAHRRVREGQDLIAFHRQSCRLFQSLEGTLSSPQAKSQPDLMRPNYGRAMSCPDPAKPEFGSRDSDVLTESTTSDENFGGRRESSEASPSSSIDMNDSAVPPFPLPTQEIMWTSIESRRCEYAKIDQAYSGLRGLWKKLTPKWCHGRNSRRKFFEGKCEGDSVRRMRLDLPGDEGSGKRRKSQ